LDLFRPLVSAEEAQQAQLYAGLSISQTIQASWIERERHPYELVDTAAWVKANQQHRTARPQSATNTNVLLSYGYEGSNGTWRVTTDTQGSAFDDRSELWSGESSEDMFFATAHALTRRWLTCGSLEV
jgi:hypothetical protein